MPVFARNLLAKMQQSQYISRVLFHVLLSLLLCNGVHAAPLRSHSFSSEFASPPLPPREPSPEPSLAPSPSPPPSPPPSPDSDKPVEYIDPSRHHMLPNQKPKCTVEVLRHDFAETAGAPPVFVSYAPPDECPAPWPLVVLELSASSSDLQKDRTAAVWLDGAEVLRTTTPVAMGPGAFWRVNKDVTRYTALLRRRSFFSMMLENSIDSFPGVYTVNVTLLFYRGPLRGMDVESTPGMQKATADSLLSAYPNMKGIYPVPPDLVVPISSGYSNNGFWFRLQNDSDVQTKTLVVPSNAYRAVLEVYASHHGGDEYWYLNPLSSTDVQMKNDGLQSVKTNGGFRQVIATIDGRFAGSAVPFPVIYPGSVNPYFWSPVAAIGAYNHPSYDFELTPFLGLLIDGMPHEFGLTVKDSQPYWLITGNLHLWLDPWSDTVEAGLLRYKAPPLKLNRQADWEENEGKSEIEGEVIIRFSGWVSSSAGNLTTSMRHHVKFKSHVEVEEKGESRTVELENKSRRTIRVERDDEMVSRLMVETEAPLQMTTMIAKGRGGGEGTRFRKVKLAHKLEEVRTMNEGKTEAFSAMTDRQVSEGSVLLEDGLPMWGKGDTKSIYKFRDNKSCYLRTVNVIGGKVKADEETASCSALAVF